MTTVDDLVISLTIKDNSNLGQLKSDIDTLLGKKGKKGEVKVEGVFPKLEKDIKFIRDKLNYLVPAVAPGITESKKFRALAAATILRVRKYRKEMPGRLLKSPKAGEVWKQFPELEPGDIGGLTDEIKKMTKDWEERLGQIKKGKSLGASAENLVGAINEFLFGLRKKGGDVLGLFRKINKLMQERQEEWEEILEGLGISKYRPQEYLYKLKPILQGKPEVRRLIEEEGGAIPFPYMKTDLKKKLKSMYRAELGGKTSAESSRWKIDIEIIDDIEKLQKLTEHLREKDANYLEKIMQEQGYIAMELKSELNETEMRKTQAKIYKEIFGDALVYIYQLSTRGGRKLAKAQGIRGIEIPSLYELRKEAGVYEEAGKSEVIQKLQEQFIREGISSDVQKSVNTLIRQIETEFGKSSQDSKDRKRMLREIQDALAERQAEEDDW